MSIEVVVVRFRLVRRCGDCSLRFYFFMLLVYCILESHVNGLDRKLCLGIVIMSILWVLGTFMVSYCLSYTHLFVYILVNNHCHLSMNLIIVIIIRVLSVNMDRSWFMGPDDSLCYLRLAWFLIMGAGFIRSLWMLSSFWFKTEVLKLGAGRVEQPCLSCFTCLVRFWYHAKESMCVNCAWYMMKRGHDEAWLNVCKDINSINKRADF